MKHILLCAFAWLGSAAFATGVPKHLGTAEQQLQAREWNRSHPTRLRIHDGTFTPQRPFSEIETTGFVAISGNSDFELPQLREAIAKNLPKDVTLIVYVGTAQEVAPIQQALGQYLDADHLKFLVTPVSSSGDPIWARDSLPFPVHAQAASGQPSAFGLVDSIYPQDFIPDPEFAKALGLPMVSTGQYFRGGNLLMDLNGNCYSENVNEVAELSDPQGFFTQYFGCKSVTLLDQQGGIGDLDERMKFLTGTDALTDNTTYAQILQQKGYTVHMIPTTGQAFETYMNTLYVNGTIFVPQMGIAEDQDALAAYTKLGFKAVGVYTKTMADDGNGNIHCVTMNYPPGTFGASSRGTQFVEFAR